MFEKPQDTFLSWKTILRDSERNVLSNAFVAYLFMLTGPMAILLGAAQAGGLTEGEMISWLFAGIGLGGVFTIVLSLLYRQPISIAWSLPAAAIVGASLQHLSFPEVVGAYVVTGVVITVISLTGVAKKGMQLIPVPIIMGMVAGVFLPFCLKLITTFAIDPWLAAITIGSFFIISSSRKYAGVLPPVLVAALAGVLLIGLRQDFSTAPLEFSIVQPVIYLPVFNMKAMLELVVPLTISVIGIHNTQGIAILKKEGYDPPVNIMTLTCGLGSVAMGLLGSVPTCITGPATAILNSSGKKESRYVGSLCLGTIMIIFALFAPVAIGLALMAPANLIALLGGLALLRVLQDAFQNAFANRFTLGALMAFMVTVSNVTFFNIGSAFWGLVGGCILSLIMERQDFKYVLLKYEEMNSNSLEA